MQWEYNQLTVSMMLQWINYNVLPLVLNTAQKRPWFIGLSLTPVTNLDWENLI